MDLHGGTLNYEGIRVLNDVKAHEDGSNKRRMRNRLIEHQHALTMSKAAQERR
jgi:hypothetical protein